MFPALDQRIPTRAMGLAHGYFRGFFLTHSALVELVKDAAWRIGLKAREGVNKKGLASRRTWRPAQSLSPTESVK